MTYTEEQLEKDLAIYKESLTPSHADEQRVIMSITGKKEQMTKGRSIAGKFWFLAPIVGMALLLIVLTSQKATKAPSALAQETDEIVIALINDELGEQSITDESDADLDIIMSDDEQLASFTSVYDANEY